MRSLPTKDDPLATSCDDPLAPLSPLSLAIDLLTTTTAGVALSAIRIEFEGQSIDHVFLVESPVAFILQEHAAQPWFALRSVLAPFWPVDSRGTGGREALEFLGACSRKGTSAAQVAKAAGALRPAETESSDWER